MTEQECTGTHSPHQGAPTFGGESAINQSSGCRLGQQPQAGLLMAKPSPVGPMGGGYLKSKGLRYSVVADDGQSLVQSPPGPSRVAPKSLFFRGQRENIFLTGNQETTSHAHTHVHLKPSSSGEQPKAYLWTGHDLLHGPFLPQPFHQSVHGRLQRPR